MKMMLMALGLLVSACDNSGVMREVEKAEAEKAKAAENQVAASQRFLEEVRARPGTEARPSGLLVAFTRREPATANNAPPPATALVLVHYEGRLADGSVFNSSFGGDPAQFPLNGVVPGFSEAIQLMRPGEEVLATMPSELGYGASGSPPAIPPNAALQFRIQLLAYRTADGREVYAPNPGR